MRPVAARMQLTGSILLFALICHSYQPAWCEAGGNSGADLNVQTTQNTTKVPLYEVFEITFQHENDYADPFLDVTIDVTLTSPSHKDIHVGGFYYGGSSDNHAEAGGRDLWKARFAPSETGAWTYRFAFRNARGQQASGHGSFTCVKGRRPKPGFVRQHPSNPFRFVFDDGSPYFPIGLQDCWGAQSPTGSVLAECSMEGPFRTDLKDPPALPAGPLFVRGPSGNPQNGDVYFRRFSQCGFNLYRFSQANCSFALNEHLDRYLVREAVMVDELVGAARKYGFRVIYGIFGFQKVFNKESHDDANMQKVKRFIKYSVNRWGAYIDFWELLNEQHADDRWYEITVPYLKSVDPYHHPVTTSWERPALTGIDVSAPHWYLREDERESDAVTVSAARNWKQHGKPVIVGEHGNYVDRNKPRPPGVGGVWDERSAVRMRIRNWTALFQEIALVFWNTSYARDGHFMNIWLGPQERSYVRAMQDFAYRLDRDVRMVPVEVSRTHAVRAYALASKDKAGVYLHHFEDHKQAVSEVSITLDVPKAGKGYWYAPENAAILKIVDVQAGSQTLNAPAFAVDLALLVTSDGPPDMDKDGRPNHLDPDDDQDGVPDAQDAFPLEPEEWADKDNDLIGDNLDADDDGDGAADDRNNNGIADHEERDFDGDGVDKARSVPWDAFPLDPKEWRDTDGDGIGDNADTDDDNDGYSDRDERQRGSDPLDAMSFPD